MGCELIAATSSTEELRESAAQALRTEESAYPLFAIIRDFNDEAMMLRQGARLYRLAAHRLADTIIATTH